MDERLRASHRFACRHSCCDELPRDVLQRSAGRLVIGRDVYAEHAAGAYGYNLPALSFSLEIHSRM